MLAIDTNVYRQQTPTQKCFMCIYICANDDFSRKIHAIWLDVNIHGNVQAVLPMRESFFLQI